MLDIPIAVGKFALARRRPIADELGLLQPLESDKFQHVPRYIRWGNIIEAILLPAVRPISVFSNSEDLLASGFEVYILSDAVSRFKVLNTKTVSGSWRGRAIITDTETASMICLGGRELQIQGNVL